MLTKEMFTSIVENFIEWCEYPAVKYKALLHFLETPYNDPSLTTLRQEFLNSDIVNELFETQSPDGSWGPLLSKDYSAKDKFPTTMVALDRCLYIGLTLDDKEILWTALDYLEDILRGSSSVKLYDRNERAIPWQMCDIATMVERIKPSNPLCDRIWGEWFYIANQAFQDGAYSHEYDKKAQHEVLSTREDRLVPLPISLLINRRADMPACLEESMLRHYGGHAYKNGYFWDKGLDKLPSVFMDKYTRRWFHTIRYINRFRCTRPFLEETINWLLDNQNMDGLWDYGTQVKDPWGYFGYFSTNRNYKYNIVVDATMEVLSVFKTYLDNN